MNIASSSPSTTRKNIRSRRLSSDSPPRHPPCDTPSQLARALSRTTLGDLSNEARTDPVFDFAGAFLPPTTSTAPEQDSSSPLRKKQRESSAAADFVGDGDDWIEYPSDEEWPASSGLSGVANNPLDDDDNDDGDDRFIDENDENRPPSGHTETAHRRRLPAVRVVLGSIPVQSLPEYAPIFAEEAAKMNTTPTSAQKELARRFQFNNEKNRGKAEDTGDGRAGGSDITW
ncbi:hypothetical protein HDU96_010431 [Phlyctochytrium bullatum]|nr:hypothetical protein HDU96_010431 [Phlyctochytrium bullatum]